MALLAARGGRELPRGQGGVRRLLGQGGDSARAFAAAVHDLAVPSHVPKRVKVDLAVQARQLELEFSGAAKLAPRA